MKSGGENSCPNFRSGSVFLGQVSSFELMFANLLYQFDTTDCYCCCIELLKTKHRPNPLFDATIVLLYNIVQILATEPQ